MSGGHQKWTCGECGESFEAWGVVADFQVDRFRRDHKEEHRYEKMTDADKAEWRRMRMRAVADFIGAPPKKAASG